MPDLGQRVVPREDRDRRSGAASLRVAAIRGLDVLVAAFDGEPSALEELGDAERGLALFVGELGLRMDRAREREQRVAPLIDRLDRALCQRLRIAHVAWWPAMSARITRSSARSASSNSSAACSDARPRRRATF